MAFVFTSGKKFCSSAIGHSINNMEDRGVFDVLDAHVNFFMMFQER